MKQMIWMGVLVGSVIGGFIPSIWGAGMLSLSSLVFSTLGAMAGIYVVFKMTH